MTNEDDAQTAPTGLEVVRRLNALQAAAMDDTLPRELREAEVTNMWRDFGALTLIAAAQLVANRAGEGMRAANARSVPSSELRRLAPKGVPAHLREAALDLVVEIGRRQPDWDKIDGRGRFIMESGQGIEAFVALLGMANGMAGLLVQFSPDYETRQDLLRAEALAMEHGEL